MKKEVIEKLAILIIGAFGLISALAWNTAIQAIFKEFLPDLNGIIAMLIYAIIITILAVFITIELGKLIEKKK